MQELPFMRHQSCCRPVRGPLRPMGWSLLLAAVACNLPLIAARAANLPDPGPATRPAGAVSGPEYHVDMKQSVEYLASDELEGRYIGTPGIAKAADYVAGAFSRLGLKSAPG